MDLPWVWWLGPDPAELSCSHLAVRRPGCKSYFFTGLYAPCQCHHPDARTGVAG